MVTADVFVERVVHLMDAIGDEDDVALDTKAAANKVLQIVEIFLLIMCTLDKHSSLGADLASVDGDGVMLDAVRPVSAALS